MYSLKFDKVHMSKNNKIYANVVKNLNRLLQYYLFTKKASDPEMGLLR